MSKTLLRRWAALLAVAAGLAGCSQTSQVTAPAPKAGPAAPAASVLTPAPPAAGMPWKIALEVDPAQPTFEKPTRFRVRLTDLAGAPVNGAQVKASLVMKLMDMGKNEVVLAEKGKGVYEGSGTFSMAGPWDVVISATAGGKSGEQKYELKVAD